MKINIYYGGRGIIDDPSLYVISRMADVLKELRVEVQQYNLFEQKNSITALVGTLRDADGIIIASTVEWYGIGGWLMQFLDSCWLYGDKEKISKLYMMPVVMSTTYGERDGMTSLQVAWEVLGGLPCDGICGYIAETKVFDENPEYIRLLDKKAENLYRMISQKITALPASNQVVKQKVSLTKSADLTPQESEQLSKYVVDDKYVKTQKADLEELSFLFRNKLKGSEPAPNTGEYVNRFHKRFSPRPDVEGTYELIVSDKPSMKAMLLHVDSKGFQGQAASISELSDVKADARLELTWDTLNRIVDGRTNFQRSFMEGNIRMKGDFKLLSAIDKVFPFGIEAESKRKDTRME